jgi:FkbM family methyltransferase
MMLDLVSLVKKYHLLIKGVIDLGTNFFQEKEVFVSLGITDFVLVEPQKHAFEATKSRAADLPSAILFNVAVSNEKGQMRMYCNEGEGQSSSILKPLKHLEEYPDIKFPRTEMVEVVKLDSLKFDRSKFNLLYADLQGNELQAFIGAKKTLKNIDAVYCEINFIELYEGCGLIGELDTYLSDNFDLVRVETGQINNGWTDAFYVKRQILENNANIQEPTIRPSLPTFDEAFYLGKYPDVAAEVKKGNFASGNEHYNLHGQYEGRQPHA